MAASPEHSDSDWPKISIITPSYQQGPFIEETIRSIVDQEYPNLEFIVIDGGSTDGTKKTLEAYDDRIDHWVSEPDRGQSHAINKGVEHATGDIIQWINSDDVLLPGALNKVGKAFQEDPEAQLVAGKTVKFGDGKKEQIVPREKEHASFESFLFNFWYMQPSCFFRADVFKGLMPLNEQLTYTMDTDLFMRYFLQHGRDHIVHLDDALLKFRMHGDSKTFSSQLGFISERVQIDQHVLRSAGTQHELSLNDLIEENVRLDLYSIDQPIDPERLKRAFDEKWNEWTHDRSKRFREVADHAGLHGDLKEMRRFAWKAILADPTRMINYRYWLHTFKV